MLSREKDALLIIDDGDGRKSAKQLGLKITGTVGILLLASDEGMLDLKDALNELKSAGFRLSDREYGKIMSLAWAPAECD